MKKYLSLFLCILVGCASFAAVDPSNTIKFGDGGTTNKKILFNRGANNPQVRWNEATSKLQFSNDGSAFSDFGTGTGGGAVGLNLLQDDNWDFEIGSPPSDWTASGGSFIAQTSGSGLLFDTQSGAWDASAASQTLSSSAIAIPNGLKGGNGAFYCYFQTAATDYKIQITDGTNVLNEVDIPALDNASKIGNTFIFPTSGNVQLKIISASDAAVVYVDNCYMGSPEPYLGTVAQSYLKGAITWTQTTNCRWDGTGTDTAPADFPTDADCDDNTITYEGDAIADASNPGQLPQIRIQNLQPGHYQIVAYGAFTGLRTSGDKSLAVFRFNDGTNPSSPNNNYGDVTTSGSNAQGLGQVIGDFTYTTGSNEKTFKLQGGAVDGARIDSGLAGSKSGLKILVYYFPTTQQTAAIPDVTNWIVDANLGGADFDLGTSAQASYIEMTNASMSMIKNTGSLDVGVACSSTNPSVVGDLTCSAGNESNGITFNLPIAGRVFACASFNHIIGVQTASAVRSTFDIVETPNNAQTILQKTNANGHSEIGYNAGAGTDYTGFPHTVCGFLNFSSSGQKTLRLMYEQTASGTISLNRVYASRPASEGNYDVHWKIFPVSQNFPKPNLVGDNVFGGVKIATDASHFVTVTSGTYTVATDSDVISGDKTHYGTATITSTAGDYGFVMPSLKAGTYKLSLTAAMYADAPTSTRCLFGISLDGGTTVETASFAAPSANQEGIASVTGIVKFDTDQTNKQISAVVQRETGTGSCYFSNHKTPVTLYIERVNID